MIDRIRKSLKSLLLTQDIRIDLDNREEEISRKFALNSRYRDRP
jgi:hypothetical protein